MFEKESCKKIVYILSPIESIVVIFQYKWDNTEIS